MDTRALMNISPIDGRYHDKVAELSNYFSEYALMKFRIYVEIEYFIALTELPIPDCVVLMRTPVDHCARFIKNSAWKIAWLLKRLKLKSTMM